MCAFLIPHRSTNTAVLSLQGMQFQGTRWDRLWTQPWGDELLSEGTRWLSPRWRGKSSSLSVLVVNKLEVLYQSLRALHHDESECYKVLIIKTCQCVCVFSKALVWWYQSWTMMVQQPHSARYCEDMIQQICTFLPGMEGPAACHTFTLPGSPCIQWIPAWYRHRMPPVQQLQSWAPSLLNIPQSTVNGFRLRNKNWVSGCWGT